MKIHTPTHLLIAILMILLPSFVTAQTTTDETSWQDLYNTLSDLDDFDEDGWTEVSEILSSLAQTPQNINEVTFQDLQQVPLLSDHQALAIINYRSLYGDIHSMSELYLITALDRPRIHLLQSLFYVAPSTKRTSISGLEPTDSVKHEYQQLQKATYHQQKPGSRYGSVIFTMSKPTYTRQGYRDGSYHGYDLSHSLRYRYNSKRLQIGFTASQDAGEPFFAGTNTKGWDFYTGFARMKNMGIVQNMVVGHYQMSLGMGLIMNSDYRLSRTSYFLTSPKTTATLRGHGSRQESNYLQGAAATIAIPIKGNTRLLNLTPFISYRAIDATMSNTEPRTITTILTTGYHRTDSEISRRNAANQFTAGASVALTLLPLRMSLNILHTSLSDSLLPNLAQRYNRYRPQGKSFTSGSLSYGYNKPRIQFTGETALSKAALATINSLRLKVSDTWTAFALQRFYSYRYQTLYGRSFGDVSNCQNETGAYIGATTTAIRNISLSAYVDCAYHPMPRYGYDGSSRSFEGYILATYTHGATTANMRYRYREQAISDDGYAIPAFTGDINGTAQHTLRLSLKHALTHWTTISQAQGTYLPSSASWGYLLSEAVGYRMRKATAGNTPLAVWASLTYFNTNEYASRLYLTDRSLLYTSTLQMLYGRGVRANVMVEAGIARWLTAAIRCNMLHYLDRKQISSAHQLIDSANQTDVQVQVCVAL